MLNGMPTHADIQAQINASIDAKKKLDISAIAQAAEAITNAYKSGHKTLWAGNGGSASDALHITAEFVGRFVKERRALPAIALCENPSSVTAIGNDYGYDQVFSRQVEAFGQPGDIFIGLSTSGNSPNVINAITRAKELGLTTIAFTGKDGGKLGKLADIHIHVPAEHTARIQEAHILVGHIICELVDQQLFGDPS